MFLCDYAMGHEADISRFIVLTSLSFVCVLRTLVMDKMEEKFQNSFQDANELTQATQFLHENGIYASFCCLNRL